MSTFDETWDELQSLLRGRVFRLSIERWDHAREVDAQTERWNAFIYDERQFIEGNGPTDLLKHVRRHLATHPHPTED